MFTLEASKTHEMLSIQKAESFCSISLPWWRLCTKVLAEKSMIVGEVVVGHAVYLHQGMVVEGELTEGVNMEDPGHPTDIEMTTKLLLTEGEVDVVDQLMQDENDKPHLKITQRLRLDQAKLDDVSKRISSSSSHAIFLALAANSGSVPLPDEGEVQSRPLRNLVSYLKQKEAAGVISLHNRETDQGGVLYAFPPCTFSMELLRRVACNLTDEGSKDDHLVVVVVRGA